ncbi:hypothetical protein J437_LFUL004397 [Ladona fulva]|uniref:Uncharacterized protein n=1 Tax=Ladona fulva TaxID=123851 RepID=A0A8K0NYI0_LADFU|nr:hypothetical protein J437_LFUL004397 [Ladona fulva]
MYNDKISFYDFRLKIINDLIREEFLPVAQKVTEREKIVNPKHFPVVVPSSEKGKKLYKKMQNVYKERCVDGVMQGNPPQATLRWTRVLGDSLPPSSLSVIAFFHALHLQHIAASQVSSRSILTPILWLRFPQIVTANGPQVMGFR